MLIGIDTHNLEGKRTGVGRYLFNLFQIWSKLNSKFPARLASPREAGRQFPNSKFILYFKDEIPSDIPQSELFECKLLKVGSTAKFIHWDLWRAAKKDKIDILFCPGYIAPIFWRGKLALTLHDIIYEARPDWFNWPSVADRILLKWVSKKSAKKASVIFTPSEFSRQEVIKYYKIPEEKIFVTRLSVDNVLLFHCLDNETIKITRVKEKYRLKDKFIFYVGSIFTRRHLAETIEAFSRLAEKDHCQFLIGGRDYTDGRAVDNMAKETNARLGREAVLRVDFIGDLELRLLYSACAFFIWLSDYEGFGLPPLEAMSLGAPVITTDSTSLKEVAGQATLLIKNNSDVEEIYQAMRRLVDNEILRQELIKKGREQAVKFSWEKCARETLKALINLK
jgi:glycosyltransferase involved in cell wall biosynthesis